jgi:hypothetical protein
MYTYFMALLEKDPKFISPDREQFPEEPKPSASEQKDGLESRPGFGNFEQTIRQEPFSPREAVAAPATEGVVSPEKRNSDAQQPLPNEEAMREHLNRIINSDSGEIDPFELTNTALEYNVEDHESEGSQLK